MLPKTDSEKRAEEVKASTASQVSKFPKVEPAKLDIVTVSSQPADDEYGSQEFINSIDGEPYLRAIRKDAPDGKTHFFKNQIHFDNCTESEAKQRYEKK